MSRRAQIVLTADETIELMRECEIATVSSIGPRGWSHTMPLWYLERDGEIWIWTFAKSQKVRNLERDPRATVLIEAGTAYAELRGVMIEAEAEIHRDPETVERFAAELGARYAEQIGVEPERAPEAFASQVPKRVVIRFRPVRTASWDHRKLGGGY